MQKGKSLELANYEFSTVVRWILDVTGMNWMLLVWTSYILYKNCAHYICSAQYVYTLLKQTTYTLRKLHMPCANSTCLAQSTKCALSTLQMQYETRVHV